MTQDIDQIIEQAGQSADCDIHLVNVALAMAAVDSPGLSIERYQNHIQKMSDEVGVRHSDLLKEGADDNAQTRIDALRYVIAETYEYDGDRETYDDLQNANLIRVIERRKGLPVTISLLYLYISEVQGWDVDVLSFPAHVVCRMDMDGQRLLFDPFNKCQILQAADLREFLKTLVDPNAELSTEYYNPSSKRDVLIRIQNNIKLRQIEGEDYMGAVKTVEMMQRLDPDEYRLLLDAGVLYARTNQGVAAVAALEKYIDLAPSQEDRRDALVLLLQIRESLN